MQKNEILEEILKEVDKHPKGMSRRNAIKLMGISPIAASVLASTTTSSIAEACADV